jgi:signal transduction histidine kinase
VLGWLSGTGYSLVLLVGLLGAALVGWHGWRSTRSASARAVWLGAVSVLAGVSVWLVFDSLARALSVDSRMWAGPLGRLLGVAVLVALGWTLSAPGFGGRRWRAFLAGGLVATAVAYLNWAPSWAQAVHADPLLANDATGMAWVWDVWQLLLAVAVGIAVVRGPQASRWVLGAVLGLAIGTLLEVVAPPSVTIPAWSHLGTLVAGTFIVAAAAVQAAALRPAGLDRAWPLRPVQRAHPISPPPNGRTAAANAAAAAPLPAAPPHSDLARVLTELERQESAIRGLTSVVTGLSERLHALEQPPAAAADVPPATPTPTAATSGPDDATGALAHQPEPERDLTIAAVAALEATRSARIAPASAAEGSPATESALAAHARRYERALEQLPWGVIVVDSDDRVAFANPAAARLLHRRQVLAGELAVALFPTPERMGYALHLVRQAQPDRTSGLDMDFESPGLRVEIEPLRDPVAGYLGAVAILNPQSPGADGIPNELVPALAEALRAPMTSILGYSELLSRMSTLSDDQVQRYLQRVDANLGRMRVMLDNLVAVMEFARTTDRPTAQPEPVDVEAAVRSAVARAQPQFGEKAVAVGIAVNGPLPQASADPQALSQIMDNLLAQAAHRSPQGGDVTVEASVRDDGAGLRAVVVSVQDRGSQLAEGSPGVLEIDEGPQPQVALTVVRWLAERQGGRAWAESDAQGARFHVRLPVRRAA